MKITLTETLIDGLTSLSHEAANQVLNTCRELMKLDNDAIEQYELAADAPQLLHDIVADMKKRAIAARRRRERREAKARTQTQAKATPTPGSAVAPEYADAINLLFSDTTIHTPEHRELMHKLVVFITERLSPEPQQPVQQAGSTSKKSRRNRRRRNRKRNRRH